MKYYLFKLTKAELTYTGITKIPYISTKIQIMKQQVNKMINKHQNDPSKITCKYINMFQDDELPKYEIIKKLTNVSRKEAKLYLEGYLNGENKVDLSN